MREVGGRWGQRQACHHQSLGAARGPGGRLAKSQGSHHHWCGVIEGGGGRGTRGEGEGRDRDTGARHAHHQGFILEG